MKVLLFFYEAHGAAAKRYAELLRHRRHKANLRSLEAWNQFPEVEACDTLVIMLAGDEVVPGELIAAYDAKAKESETNPEGGSTFHYPNVISIAPGDPLWEASDDELRAMGDLNKLRHDAALLGIAIDPAWDSDRLVVEIKAAEAIAAERKTAEEAEALKIEEAAEIARKAREAEDAAKGQAAGGSGVTTESTEAETGGAPVGDAATPPVAAPQPSAEAVANADALVKLAGVDHSDVAALRAFAQEHKVPLSPNQNVKPEKLLAAIRAKLGA